jgi:Arc/MetJ-type ribon-helix-helix transcriptional regulator
MKVARVNVRLPFKLKQFVDGEIKAGRFKNVSDAVSEAIRLLMQDAALAETGSIGYLVGEAGGDSLFAAMLQVQRQTAKESHEDLKLIMDDIKAVTTAKRAMRCLIAKVGYDVAENAGQRNGLPALRFGPSGLGSESLYHRMPLPHPDPGSPGRVRVIPTDMYKGRITDVCVLHAIQDELLGKLDGMSEMTEMISLRLQMMMDRRSKLISTLSNIMKKISDAQNTLIQNLK